MPVAFSKQSIDGGGRFFLKDPFAQAFRDETGRDTTLTQTAFETATAPETFVACRDRPGGPAPAALARAFETYRAASARLAQQHSSRTARISEADATRTAAFDRLLET